MICPRCGENNPETYHFCGMCGSALESKKKAAVTEPARVEAQAEPVRAGAPAARPGNMAFSRAEPRGQSPASGRVEPISGPSLLGLNQPTTESLRDTAFSSMETYYEDERRPAWGRIFLVLVILAGIGYGAWWRYTKYGKPGQRGTPSEITAMNRTGDPNAPAPEITGQPQTPDTKQATEQAKNEPPAQPAAAGTPDAGQPSEKDLPPASNNETANANVPPAAAAKPAEEAAQPSQPEKPAVKPEKPVKVAKADAGDIQPKAQRAAASSEGDALFRKGEAYLYGHGVRENCDQAIRYLKLASAKSHAKARSTFGTMYATGHCVPRDLPSSYHWFALALQADPNNNILEKDLTAIWNQMTPPERQLATKLNQ